MTVEIGAKALPTLDSGRVQPRVAMARRLAPALLALPLWLSGCSSPAAPNADAAASGDAAPDTSGPDQDAASDGAQTDASAVDAGGGLDPQCAQPGGATARPDGAPCDDGRACTVGDACALGVCKPGAQACPCEPGHKPCAQAGAGDAKNLCRGAESCVPQAAGAALPYACAADPLAAKVCDASLDAACTKNACAPLTGACSVTPVELDKEI